MSNQPLAPPLAGNEFLSELCSILQDEFSRLPLNVLLVYLIDLVQSPLLPILAEQFHITGDECWNLAESDDAKRSLIKKAIELHRYKGTPWSIREVIRSLGFGEVDIIEHIFDWCLDGSVTLCGSHVLGDTDAWARYRIILKEPITNDQAINLRNAIICFAPARSYLESLDFQEAAFRLDGSVLSDGKYNLGTINYG